MGSRGPFTLASYKDVRCAKEPISTMQPQALLGPYIVEKMKEMSVLEINNAEVKHLFKFLQARVVICKFNDPNRK